MSEKFEQFGQPEEKPEEEQKPKEQKPGEKEEVKIEKGEEGPESQIEKLTDDEKRFFEIQKQAAETIEMLEESLKRGDINEDFYKETAARVAYLRKEAAEPLVEKIGDRDFEIENLRIELMRGENPQQKEKIAEKSEDIIQKLTPENVEVALKTNKPIEVRVKRSSGEIEDGWVITVINTESGLARVYKFGKEKEEKTIYKDVPLEELKEWNKLEENKKENR